MITRSKPITVKHPQFGEREPVIQVSVPAHNAESENAYAEFEQYFGGVQEFVAYVLDRITNGGANNARASITKAIPTVTSAEEWEKAIATGIKVGAEYTVRTGITAKAAKEGFELARTALAGKSLEEIQANPELIAQALAALRLN